MVLKRLAQAYSAVKFLSTGCKLKLPRKRESSTEEYLHLLARGYDCGASSLLLPSVGSATSRHTLDCAGRKGG